MGFNKYNSLKDLSKKKYLPFHAILREILKVHIKKICRSE